MPTLYVVATPIGNLEDITLRALRVLREVGLIAAEDTRVTRRLLDRHQIQTPLTSYHEHNKRAKLRSLLEALKEKDVALVSDAGTPAVNDPGSDLVSAAAHAGFPVVPIPGPSAVTSAIAASGLPIDQFVYLGFLPKRRSERRRLLESLATERRTLVAFEAPGRVRATLTDVVEVLEDPHVAVCRELTKLHEEVFRGLASDALEHFGAPRGEFTLVIEGGSTQNAPDPLDEERARALLARLRADGALSREAVARVVEETGVSRRRAYELWLESAGAARDPKTSPDSSLRSE